MDKPEKPLTVLVLQGGGALGAYQGGALEALSRSTHEPGWIAGISIGAIHAALMAGNPPSQRVDRLRAFWHRVSSALPAPAITLDHPAMAAFAADLSAAWAVAFGIPGFFRPRPGAAFWPGPFTNPSYYDTSPLAETLASLVDFDRLNDSGVRVTVGAVDVQSGNMTWFDNRNHRLGVEHILASAALPPGFPAVEIGGRWYWDGGLVSNTPLKHVIECLDCQRQANVIIFQLDVFDARGPLPTTHAEVIERIKDIRYSSRTRAVTDGLATRLDLHRQMRELIAKLPDSQRDQAAVQRQLAEVSDPAIQLVHLIYRQDPGLAYYKDFEFSAATINEHWQAGRADMHHSLAQLARAPAAPALGSFRIYDWTEPRLRSQYLCATLAAPESAVPRERNHHH